MTLAPFGSPCESPLDGLGHEIVDENNSADGLRHEIVDTNSSADSLGHGIVDQNNCADSLGHASSCLVWGGSVSLFWQVFKSWPLS